MFRSLAEYVEKVVDVTCGKMVWAGYGNELKEQSSGKNVQHGSKRSIHKGDDGSSTCEVLLFLCQYVAGRKLAAFANGPRIGPTIFVEELINQGGDDVLRCVRN